MVVMMLVLPRWGWRCYMTPGPRLDDMVAVIYRRIMVLLMSICQAWMCMVRICIGMSRCMCRIGVMKGAAWLWWFGLNIGVPFGFQVIRDIKFNSKSFMQDLAHTVHGWRARDGQGDDPCLGD